MTFKNKVASFMLVLCASMSSASFGVDTIGAADIISNTANCGNDCVEWKLKGVCFWLKCVWFKCKVKESAKVSHYIPDFVVSAYTTDSPLKDINGINSNTPNANLTQSLSDERQYDGPLDFKHAEVVGHPMVVVFNALADNNDYFCHSVVKVPYFPYFLSGIDNYWRSPNLEHFYPQAITGYPKIKTDWPLGYWAQIYPLCGWGSHPYDAINAAVAAHRAGVIVTGTALHLHIPPSTDCDTKCWPPGEIKEGKLSTHKFQMIFPVAADTGMVMGGSAAWANGKNKHLYEGYAWSLWRPYTCCHKKGQVFITSIDFPGQ